jgi:hypothetical protein
MYADAKTTCFFLYVFIVLRQQKAFRILMQLGAASGHVHAGR